MSHNIFAVPILVAALLRGLPGNTPRTVQPSLHCHTLSAHFHTKPHSKPKVTEMVLKRALRGALVALDVEVQDLWSSFEVNAFGCSKCSRGLSFFAG